MSKVTTTVAPVDKTRHLQVVREPGRSEDRMYADLVTDGLATNAIAAIQFIKPQLGDVSLTELMASLRDQGEAVNRGDFGAAERMLSAQAVALNAVFAEMARRAALNMGEHLGATESYMRLALKAQSQSRATVETLSAIKNPPVIYAKQANFAAGHQQLNNAPGTFAHAGENDSARTELLEQHDGKRLDAGAEGEAGATDPWLATVGAIDRAANDRGQGESEDEPLPGREAGEGAGVRAPGARAARQQRPAPRGRRGGR